MTFKISLIGAAGIAALALTASAASAQASSPESGPPRVGHGIDPKTYPVPVIGDGFQRAVKAQLAQAMAEDGLDRAVRAKPTHQPNVSRARGERAVAPVGTAYASGASAESGIEWPGIGLGFGAGIVLALGFVFGLRLMRVRPYAH
jgi:hypothetical protein